MLVYQFMCETSKQIWHFVFSESNVIMEADTACNALYTKYKVVGKHVKLPAGGLKKEKLIRREGGWSYQSSLYKYII